MFPIIMLPQRSCHVDGKDLSALLTNTLEGEDDEAKSVIPIRSAGF